VEWIQNLAGQGLERVQNSHECAPGKSSRMDTKFESVVEMVNPSVLAKFRDVNGSRCAAIGAQKHCEVE
jgi:hypothetical protein